MTPCLHSRRKFIKTNGKLTLTTMAGSSLGLFHCTTKSDQPVVSIARIKNDDIEYAVEQAIDLLGGMNIVARNKDLIMLKPNLVTPNPACTTNPTVIQALARIMKRAGKEVWIGEGSAVVPDYNYLDNIVRPTRKEEILNPMQEFVFDVLGYNELAKSEHLPLINLHTGDLVEKEIANSLAFSNITLHKSLFDIDMLCSVPMMKTHFWATVTLGMKNLIGVYPGKVYCSMRSCLHDEAAALGSPGIAYEIVDMVRANKLGLTVIDGSMAMEGDGPVGGNLVKMDLIIAGTNPLATDMVAANIMGFEPQEVPTFTTAMQVGMTPTTIEEIEIRGERIADVRKKFVRPNLVPWINVSPSMGAEIV